jgi:hypothetical protein
MILNKKTKKLKFALVVVVLMLMFGFDVNAQSNPNNALGDNQLEVEPGVFAIYSGDVNQDGFIGVDDVAIIDNDNAAGAIGYVVTDLNGDGFLGVDDVAIADNNNALGIFAITP